MSDQGGSDLDVFENLSKKPGSDSKQKTLVGMNLPAPGSKAPPPPPSKSVPAPPSGRGAPPPPAPSAAMTPPPPSKAPPPPAPSGATAPPPPISSKAPPPPVSASGAVAPPPSVPPARRPSVEPPTTEDEHDVPVDLADEEGDDEMTPTRSFEVAEPEASPEPQADEAPPAAVAAPPPAPTPPVSKAPPPPTPSAVAAPPPPAAPSVSKAPPPPTPSAAAAPPAPTPSVAAAPPPPTPAASSEPLAPPATPDNDWDDDDEKTTVFDRSHEESAQALLQKSPKPGAGVPPKADSSVPAPASKSRSQAAPAAAVSTSAASASAPPTQPAPASHAPMHEKKSNAGLFAAIAALVVLAVGAFFFMGGKDPGGLVITVAGPDGTEVEGVSVLVDGEVVCSSSSCKVSDLAAGTYLVKAEAEGFKKMAGKAFEVTEGKQTAVNLELIGDTSTSLEVNTKAPGLTLTLDGKKVGSLPQKLEGLEPGKHEVEIGGSDFFAPFSQTITLAEGELFTLEPELELKQGQVTVELGDGAKDAKVYLVGGGKKRPLQKLIEKGSPLLLPVDGTKYEVVATQKGFEDFAETIEFTVAEPVLTITVDMEKDAEEEDSPSSSSSAPAPARATAPAPSPSPQPAPSPAPASAPAPQPAATGAGKLNINSIPVSNVILDGRPLGTTPKIGVSVPAGNHTVVFVHPQHGRKVRSVSVSPGGVATAAVRFP